MQEPDPDSLLKKDITQLVPDQKLPEIRPMPIVKPKKPKKTKEPIDSEI